jgi:LysR family nitrogen assimilation transcriptional regulator
VVQQGKPLEEPLTVTWNGRRALPRYARAFCELLDGYMREVFPTLQAPSRKVPRSVRRASVERK